MSTTNINHGSLVTFSIKTNGKAISDTIEILSIDVEKRINSIPTVKIIILDSSPSTSNFEVSSSNTFVPGVSITIEAGYDSVNQLIFKGIVTKQSIRITETVGSVLEVECRDETVKMAVGRKSITYSKKKDSDIINSIIGNYSGVSHNITATTTEYPEQVQYYTSDWDFILTRAEANGMIVTALNGNISVFPPSTDTTAVLEVKYGDNLLEFNAALDAVTQIASAEASAWDYVNQEMISELVTNDIIGSGNLSTEKLSEVVGLTTYELQTSASLTSSELADWSKNTLAKSTYSKIQGEVKFQGTNLADPGKYITLGGLGDRFNGDHIISSVHHVIAGGSWTTEASFGISPDWLIKKPEVLAPPASGLVPRVQGLINGTVKQINEDPNNQLRILVDLPLLDTNGEGIWARLTNFYSTSGAGVFFMPEVGDEVIVGFLNDNPKYPIILGSLYSNPSNKPFEGLNPNKKNSKKAIVSKSGITLEFDDENKELTLNTPAKNQIVCSDKDGQIKIKDQNENSIAMSSSGILIKSAKNITFEADQQVVIKGQQGVSIESSGGDVQTKGININTTAQREFSAEGSQTAQVQARGELTLKGAMVMIN
ncbi:Rhs element Vgr protein [Roseivirga ehrenbergii]|uniref:Type IV secretion protein Rhs n=1 Tax=Roseivirga ehrenbergii (strain DSM 102268 / JCM 13514 / KCTC 12282 / NCIMB 14502 / KMM 6017) TaxID=279360 RepID=A0A150X6W7_ROSEK|nr:type VI secretion system tip protein VgrG [Roseivirga ehrenbergii]KYG74487.1 type IV secretion protein Rhs [Roseivirga ehrenbergii]TCL14206.1 Rhs element Vgr protein [Roseivirga ehrenbergii]